MSIFKCERALILQKPFQKYLGQKAERQYVNFGMQIDVSQSEFTHF